MNHPFTTFQDKINAVQSAFKAVEAEAGQSDLFTLKDGVFDAISDLGNAVQDPDLRQLLARTAIDIHLFPTNRDGWEMALVEAVEFAIATAFQTIAFLEIEIEDDIAVAA